MPSLRSRAVGLTAFFLFAVSTTLGNAAQNEGAFSPKVAFRSAKVAEASIASRSPQEAEATRSKTAKTPRLKALIIDGQNNHNWRESTPVLKKLLEQTGLFQVAVATSPPEKSDMSRFRPKFASHDVVVVNYTGDPWPAETNAALEKYMREGGGLVIYHAANNAFPDWPAWNEMIGLGGWNGRDERHGPYVYYRDGQVVRDTSPGPGGSHGPQHPFTLVVREPDHPITKGLPREFLHVADELYNSLRGPAKNMTILATAHSPKEKGGTGRDEPMLMTIGFGKGRVFHTALGHAAEQLRSAAFIVTFQRGAEWAATGRVIQPVPKGFLDAGKSSVR